MSALCSGSTPMAGSCKVRATMLATLPAFLIPPLMSSCARVDDTSVRFGSLADIGASPRDELYPQKRTSVECSGCPLCAKSGLMQCSKEGRYSIALSARARIDALVSRKDYSALLRADAPTRPTNVAKDLVASNSSSRREASVVGSPNVSSGRRNASARGHTARSMS